MLTGSCHCGKVHFRVDFEPEGVTACNCTVCRRYGVLWTYGTDGVDVHVEGQTKTYRRGQGVDFLFCPECGCVVAWRGQQTSDDGRRRMAVNIRMCEPEAVAAIPIDHFDGLHTFDDLPRDGRMVSDYWF